MKRIAMIIGGCVLLAAGIVAAAATGDRSHQRGAAATPHHQSASQHQRRVPAQIAILRRRVAATAASVDTTALAGGVLAGRLDVSRARVAASTPTGVTVLAVPGAATQAGSVCVVALVPLQPGPNVPAATAAHPAAATACLGATDFNSEGVHEWIGDGDLVGLVPDGVDRVTLALTGGGTRSVGVSNNAYAVHTDTGATSLTFAGPAGKVVQDLGPASG